MKKLLLILVCCFFSFYSLDAFAQKNKKKSKKSKQAEETVEKPQQIEEQTVSHELIITEKPPVPPISEEEIMQYSKPFVQTEAHGHIDWTNQYVEAKGEAVIDTVRFKNYGQARAMALRGAVVVAQRNLLEIIKGVHVTGETTVQDMITTSDIINSRVDGVIKGAQTVGEPVEKYGMIEVTMRVMIYDNKGLAPAVYTNKSTVPVSSDPIETNPQVITTSSNDNTEPNFVFNLNGKSYDPAMFPVVVDENGKVLMDMSNLYDPKKGQFPKILNTSREIMELANFQKGVEIIDIVETQPGKLVVGDASKSKINWSKIGNTAAKIGKFLLMLL